MEPGNQKMKGVLIAGPCPKKCEICAQERQRRNCIILDNDRNQQRYKETPFADAPFVHPFRAPSYHAQHLRSINIAADAERRILWVTAHDKMMKIDKQLSAEKEEERKERWLEYHERATGGIPGLLPLILNLKVRFTDAPDSKSREQGIFKHTRGTLRGWDLVPEEENASPLWTPRPGR